MESVPTLKKIDEIKSGGNKMLQPEAGQCWAIPEKIQREQGGVEDITF